MAQQETELKIRIHKLDVLSVGKTLALIYLAFGLIFMIPMMLFGGLASMMGGAGAAVGGSSIILTLLTPILWAGMGFVGGCVLALVYNLVVKFPKFGGGVVIHIQEHESRYFEEIAAESAKPMAQSAPIASTTTPRPNPPAPVAAKPVVPAPPSPPPAPVPPKPQPPVASAVPAAAAKPKLGTPPPPPVLPTTGAESQAPKPPAPVATPTSAPIAKPQAAAVPAAAPPTPAARPPAPVAPKAAPASGYKPEIGMPESGAGLMPGRAPGSMGTSTATKLAEAGENKIEPADSPIRRPSSVGAMVSGTPQATSPAPAEAPSPLTEPKKDGK